MQLFRPNRLGAWYDPVDRKSLFQDAAATTPVTQSGQPVGCVQDKSGNGYHLVQPLGPCRPTFRSSSGLCWLEFDGIDDRLNFAKPINLSNGGIIVGLIEAIGRAIPTALLSGGLPGYLAITGNAATRTLGKNNGGMINPVNTPTPFPMTSAQPAMIRLRGGLLEVSRWTDGTVFRNGTLGADGMVNVAQFGAFTAMGEIPFAGRMFGMVLTIAQPSATEVNSALRFLAARM